MKRYYWIIITGLLLISGGCNDWLKVDSTSRVIDEKMFEDPEGFRTAVNGVYRLLGMSELYGKNLSWGMVSVLGHNYDTEWYLPQNHSALVNEDYAHKNNQAMFSSVWESAYRVIANCNNIIGQLQNRDASFFPEGMVERDLIYGEMLGVRAMVHLDILRLFAPAPVVDDGKLYIPYVTVYPEKQAKHMTVNEVMDSIISDLEKSKHLLAYHDTLYNIAGIQHAEARFSQIQSSVKGGLFFGYRGTRMNYFAATSFLARAYMWRDDRNNAYRCAQDMYRFSTKYNWFGFTPTNQIAVSDMSESSRKMFRDIVFAAVNNNLYDLFEAQSSGIYYFQLKNTYELFQPDNNNDIRKKSLISNTSPLYDASFRWMRPEKGTSTRGRTEGPLAPVIRLSEAYYTMIECLAYTDLEEAKSLLTKVRNARGAITNLPELDRKGLLDRLYNEMTREFLSEGQTFYLYKRLNAPIFNGSNPLDMTGRYVLPVPYVESAYNNL